MSIDLTQPTYLFHSFPMQKIEKSAFNLSTSPRGGGSRLYIRTRIFGSNCFLRVGCGCCCRGNETCGEMDGDRVANGDSDGEKLGDMADDVLKPPDASWLIGERGNKYWFMEPKWLLLLLRTDNTGIDRGAMFVSSGGGIFLMGCWSDSLLLALDAPLFALCSDIVSSLRRAISENTWANGWYCGPQSSR